jgi:electron transport complex protein RnfD
VNINIGSAPHIKHDDGVQISMVDVIIVLVPILAIAIFYYGIRSLTITLMSIISCLVFERIFNSIFNKRITIKDFSAVVTGFILAMLLPVTVPLWYPVLGAFIAIVFAKMAFGGLGKNIFNPALIGIAFLSISGTARMRDVPIPLTHLPAFQNIDTFVQGERVLNSLKSTQVPSTSTFDMFIGNQAGPIGVTAILVILAAALYLLYRRIITWHIPVSILGTVAIFAALFPRSPSGPFESICFELMGGSLLFCSIFAATDPVTTPVSRVGKIIFGVCCGILTMMVRYFGYNDEGIVFAILVMNASAFALDKAAWRFKSRGVQKNELS